MRKEGSWKKVNRKSKRKILKSKPKIGGKQKGGRQKRKETMNEALRTRDPPLSPGLFAIPSEGAVPRPGPAGRQETGAL